MIFGRSSLLPLILNTVTTLQSLPLNRTKTVTACVYSQNPSHPKGKSLFRAKPCFTVVIIVCRGESGKTIPHF